MLTVDTAVLGRRERDIRRGFSLPPKIGLEHARRRRAAPGVDVGVRAQRAHPLRQRRRASTWATAPIAVKLADYINTQFDPSLSWADVEWLRSCGTGPS